MVLPFTFLLKCSQDIVQVANGMTETLTLQGTNGRSIRGSKSQRRINLARTTNEKSDVNCRRLTNQPQTTNRQKSQCISNDLEEMR